MNLENSDLSVNNREKLFNAKGIQAYMMIITLITIWVIFEIATGGIFLSFRNLSNLSRQMAITGILSIGMAVCIIAGSFDLSVGSIAAFIGALAGVGIYKLNMGTIEVIVLVMLIGVLIGIWQGYWIAYRNVPAFIVTLGGQMIFRGATLLTTKGNAIPVSDKMFLYVGQEYFPKAAGYILATVSIAILIFVDLKNRKARVKYGFDIPSKKMAFGKYLGFFLLIGVFIFAMNDYEGVPLAVVLLIILTLVFMFILNNMQFGRYVYAVGGNEKAARLSGISNSGTIMKVFVIMGVLSAIAGILQTSRLAAATPNAGLGFELDAIASCVIGGISLNGGRGKIFSAIIGALVMASLSNGMSLLNMDAAIQYVIKGLILIVAVWFDVEFRNKRN